MDQMPHIKGKDLRRSFILKTIQEGSDKPVVFLPNYGEFGPVVDKIIKLVHFYKSPRKIVCCRRGEESLYPSADEFYYDWTYDLIDEEHRWGLFTKRNITLDKNRKQRNPKYDIYKQESANEYNRIISHFGPDHNYLYMWNFGPDMIWANRYSHLFKFKFPEKQIVSNRPDIVISPRKRSSRPENNFNYWDEFCEGMQKEGYTIGCVGQKDTSHEVKGSIENSWDYEDYSGACIEMIQRCKLYVGLDTGPSHLAAFMSTPMIVFQPTPPDYSGVWMMQKINQDNLVYLGDNIENYDIIIKSALDRLRNDRI